MMIAQGNAQDLYAYYESLWSLDNVTTVGVEKEVDSLLSVSENRGEELQSIKIAHEFSKRLYKEDLYEKGIYYVTYEISRYQKLGLKNDQYAKALYNLGLFYALVEDFEKAIISYKGVIAVNKDEYSKAKAFCQLGKYYYQKGDFFRSNDYYEQGLFVLEKFDRKKLLIKKYIDYSHVLFEIGSKSSLDKMLAVLEKANRLFDLTSDYSSRDYYTLNNDYAIYYGTQERLNLEKVRYYCYRNLNKAIQDNDSTYIYSAYTNLGDLYTKLKVEKYKDSALFYLNKALNYTRNSREKSIVLHNQSNYFLKNNKYLEALSAIQKALVQSTRLKQDISALPDLDGLKVLDNKYNVLLALTQKATILIKLYEKKGNQNYLELALANLLSADKLIDILLTVSKEDGSRLHWREEASEIYLKGILVCENLKDQEKAFYFSEKKKALLLTEDIIANIDKSILPGEVLTLENDLKKRILELENLISVNKNFDSIARLESTRFNLKQQYQKQEDSLQVLFPEYYVDKEATDVVNLNKVQEKLDDKSVIISYVSNEDEDDDSFSIVYATLVSKTQSEIIKIGELSVLEELVITYRNQLSTPFEKEEDRIAFVETASELYNLLIPKDKISMSLDKQHLIIIPDETLQYIPFESLVVDRNTNRYLIEDNEISYAYSMSFLEYNANVKRTPSKDLVSFAPLKFEHGNFEEIANSINEIHDIDIYVSSDIYKEKEASKENFLSKTGDHKIIHLATHANFSDNLQIAFHDTNLEYHELYTSKNQAELVVLSACNTSLGELAKGEGVMSLARGFFYAGANTVISSLWNANDKSTARVMKSFYSNLDKGQTKSKALHNAKINYLESASLSDASPHYWATFVLIGDSETELFPSNMFLYGILFSILLVLVIGALIFFLKKQFLFLLKYKR